MATNTDNRARMLTMRELAELRRDMLEASAWMRTELRYRRMQKQPGGVEAGHPNLSPKDASNRTCGSFDS